MPDNKTTGERVATLKVRVSFDIPEDELWVNPRSYELLRRAYLADGSLQIRMPDDKTTDPPERIPARGGGEEDVFSGWRRVLCYTSRPGVCKAMKRSYSRRLRKIARLMLKDSEA